jgi:tripartite-type tricarboxylate transporter receptor subunit TctC
MVSDHQGSQHKAGMRSGFTCVALIAALLATAGTARPQAYPSRPITMVNPFPPGGATDILARTLTEHMRTTLRQPIIVEDVPGAGGSIGAGRVARAAPDGYTLGFGNWASHVGSGAMYPLPFDLLKDLEPVAVVAIAPLWMVGRNAFPARDMNELVAWLKSNPDKAMAATVGIGSGSHLCGLYLQKSFGLRFQFVPYRGGLPAMQDMVAGNVDIMCDLSANSLPFVRNGQIKAYAVMARQRWFAAPDVPTIEETGLPGLYVTFWHGVWVPKGTPGDVLARLNDAIVAALADAGVQRRFSDQGHEIPPRERQTAKALGDYQKAEIEKRWPVIKAANIKPE